MKNIKEIFTVRYRMYWFPKVALLLEMRSSSLNFSLNSVSNFSSLPLVIETKSYVKSKGSNPSKTKQSNQPPRVYYTIFAGRREFMAIHLKYTDMLLAAKLVTEVHIWDFAPVLVSFDIGEFIRRTPRDGYRLFRRRLRDVKYIGGKLNEGYVFQSYYTHYSSNERYQPSDVIVKADDDIVFLDILHFEKYVSNISYSSFHFPNIVNNDVSFVIQAKRRVHPLLPRLLEAYEGSGADLYARMSTFITSTANASALSIYSICPITTLYCVDGEGGDRWGGLFESGIIARALHSVFLEDPSGFIRRSRSKGTRYVQVARRVSINMFAVRISLFREAFTLFLTPENCCDDEGYIGKWASMSGAKHIIDTHFTVVHFAFGPQRILYAGNLTLDLSKYAMLSKAMNALASTYPF